MTTTLRTDANRDLYVADDGRLALSSGRDAVLQLCASAARTLQGECILEAERGIPFFDTAFAGVPSLPQFEAAFRREVSAVPGVVRISAYAAVVEAGVLRYTATIVTTYGEATLSG